MSGFCPQFEVSPVKVRLYCVVLLLAAGGVAWRARMRWTIETLKALGGIPAL